MYAQVANDFSPVVRLMYASAAITQGHFVKRVAGVSLEVPDPVDGASPMRYVLPIQMCAPSITAHQEAVIGIAMESATANTWVPVCVGGPCQLRVAVSCTATAGAPFGATSASIGAGVELGLGATHISVPCWAISQQTVTNSGVSGAAFLNVYIEPIRVAGGGGAYT
jgi:hypothetical protein